MRRQVLVGLACLFAAAQVIRFEHTNPPITRDVAAPPAVEGALRRACYDCHSNETRWPWFASLAPISWLVHRDVTEGRGRLNFSRWDAYASDPGTELQKLKHLRKVMAEEDMPPWYYRLVHPDSELGPSQQEAIARWVTDEITSRTPSAE